MAHQKSLVLLLLSFFVSVKYAEACTENGYFPNPDLECQKCQEENVAYFGNNIENYAPISRDMGLEDCQKSCATISECKFWSYHTSLRKCYLKTHREQESSLAQLGHGFISGVKVCPLQHGHNQQQPPLEIVAANEQKLHALPATFGQQIHPGIKVRGFLADEPQLKNHNFCQMIPYDPSRADVIAKVPRGECEFSTKAFNAQAAGFKGLVILDTRNGTIFTKLIASDLNAVPASFIRIPVVFLLLRESQIFDQLSKPGQEVIIQQSSEDDKSVPKLQNQLVFPSYQKESIWDKIKALSPLTLAIIGSAILVSLVLVVALQVCICSKCCCCKRRSRNRVLPDHCGNAHCSAFNEGFYNGSSSQLNSNLTSLADAQQSDQMDLCCPVCLEIPLFPKKIFQCSQGHTVCDECLAKIEQKCPTCRESWLPSSNLPVRNRMAESMLSNFVGTSPMKSMYSSTTTLAEVNVQPYAPSAPPLILE